jgi:choline kinase
VRAIIFAAGMGTRISRHIADAPKCLVRVFGLPLISYTVDLLRSKGIHDIAVVTGYKAEQVERALPPSVRVIRNPFFSITNSIASFWLARDFVAPTSSLLAMNGDVFMEETLLEQVIDQAPDGTLATMVADSSRIDGADYKFRWSDGRLEKYGKHLTAQETSGEYVGLGMIPQHNINEVLASAQHEVMQGNYNKWWEEAIYVKSEFGRGVGVMDIAGHFWVELDFIEDLARLNEYMRIGQRVLAE